MKDAFEAGVTQINVLLVFLVLYHKKIALKGGCAGEDGYQTADESLQDRVRVSESVPITPVRVYIVKYVNGDLQFRLVTVCITQVLVLAPNILNLLYAEGVVEKIPVDL